MKSTDQEFMMILTASLEQVTVLLSMATVQLEIRERMSPSITGCAKTLGVLSGVTKVSSKWFEGRICAG